MRCSLHKIHPPLEPARTTLSAINSENHLYSLYYIPHFRPQSNAFLVVAGLLVWSFSHGHSARSVPATAYPAVNRVAAKPNPAPTQTACLSLAMMPCMETDKATVISALTDAAQDANTEVANNARTALKLIAPDRAVIK